MNLENIVQDVKCSRYTNLAQFHEDTLIDEGVYVDNYVAQQKGKRPTSWE